MAFAGQLSLFGHGEPDCDRRFARLQHVSLEEGAWLEIVPGWLSGDAALFELLCRSVAWKAERRRMYDRQVDVPRLHANIDGEPVHPVIEHMRMALDSRYGTAFVRTSVALYRDGSDSVAWHGDFPARRTLEDTFVATVSLGAPRTFLLRRKGGGPSRSWSLGAGDLLVMGGACQRTHEHCVPKVASAPPRIALMYRPVWG